MKKMRKATKKAVALGMTFAMLAGVPSGALKAFAANGQDSNQTASAVTRSSIHDGAILHAFCWNFNTIKENMADIAAAGYTAVQTSPINECLAIHNGMKLYGDTEDEGRWYYHYQPTDWKIGNYQLGTRDEFKAMCAEADKYGIGVIVDIDPNHTTPLYDQVSDDLKNAAGGEDALYHIGAKVENGDNGGMKYDNRTSVTYDAMGGLPDVDTENEGFQKYFYDFLEDCIECGADGFRVDTAKHIALPDDGVAEEYAGEEDRNDFYPNMKSAIDAYGSKNYSDLFVYGEVLDGDASRVAAYQDMLGGTCASNYGGAIRNAVSSGSVAVKKLQNYKISDDTSTGKTYTADSNKLVTWVESHDNYINDKSYKEIDDRDVVLAWAIITARADGTPLFFSRPDGSSAENPWGNNVIGAAGSDIYKAPEVVAVNKFRTAMEGQDENLRNPGNNNSVLMVERGNKGVVIINASENDYTLDSETNLSDGTYADSVEGRDSLYTVADGNIYGTVPAKSVVVLDEPADGDYSTLFFHNTNHWSDVSACVLDDVFPAKAQANDWWMVTIPEKEFKVVFKGDEGQSAEFSISEKSGRFMTAMSDKLYSSKVEAEDALGIVTKTVYFLNTEEWKTVYAYAWTGGNQYLGGWPGTACVTDEGYWVKAEIKMIGDNPFEIIFNNYDGSQTENIDMSDMSKNVIALSDEQPGGNLVVDKYSSKAEAEEATGINADSLTVHYYDAAGWGTVGVYTWGDVDLGGWPGQQCESEGDGWWKYTINSTPSSNLNIIFNNMPTNDDDKRQTEDMKADSLKNVYFIGANYKYASKAAALEALETGTLKLQKGDPSPVPEEKVERKIGEEAPLADDETRVYIKLDDDAYAKEANLYCWTDGDNIEYFGGWPGKALTHIGNNWYSINVKNEMLFTEKKELDEELLESEELEEEELEEALVEEEADVESEDTAAEAEEVAEDESEVEAETEEAVEAEDVAAEAEEESESLVEEITDTLVSFFNVLVSAFSPLEVQAADYQVFKDGIHLITNNNDGFQEDDVQARFTTVRPSESELNPVKEEPAEPTPAESETPVEPETPAPAPAPEESAPTEPVVTPSEPATTTPATPAESNNSGSAAPAQPAASTGSSSNSGSSASQSASQSAPAVSAPTTVAIADTQTPTVSPEVIVTAQAENKAAVAPKKTKTASVKADAANEESLTEAEAAVEADSKIEEETEVVTEEEVAEEEATTTEEAVETIEDEAAPLAAEEGGFNPALLIAVIVIIALAGAAGVVVYRKKN